MIQFVPYTDDWIPRVREFNQRLIAGGSDMIFTLRSTATYSGATERWLAAEGEIVRGGYLLQRQRFSFSGEGRTIAHIRLPISEGVVNPAYALVGAQVLRHAMKREPEIYTIGSGGFGQPLTRMQQTLGWAMHVTPFRFRVPRPARFLRQLPLLRTTPTRRLALNAAAASGLGTLGLLAWQRARSCASGRGDVLELTETWGEEVNRLWLELAPALSFAAVRDAAGLAAMYPTDPRFLRCHIRHGRRFLGWALLMDTPMRGHRHFGDLRVGTLVDFLGHPADLAAIIAAATHFLRRRGVDLIISNQCHRACDRAFDAGGFFRGPSNFVLALSPALADRLQPLDSVLASAHLNRGDGDGPINL